MGTYENFTSANNSLMEYYKKTEPISYESVVSFDKESLFQDERKAVYEFISSGALTFKSLDILKLRNVIFKKKINKYER